MGAGSQWLTFLLATGVWRCGERILTIIHLARLAFDIKKRDVERWDIFQRVGFYTLILEGRNLDQD